MKFEQFSEIFAYKVILSVHERFHHKVFEAKSTVLLYFLTIYQHIYQFQNCHIVFYDSLCGVRSAI